MLTVDEIAEALRPISERLAVRKVAYAEKNR